MATKDDSASNNGAPKYGDLVETWVTERFDYEHVDEQWYDHVGNWGTKIQVKGTQVWIEDGYRDNGDQRYRRGRFRLWEGDHKKLREDDSVYLFILYDDEPDCINVVHWEHIHPDDLLGALPSGWWDEENARCAAKGRSARINWPNLIDKEEVDYDR
jgi:hypothetical protein